MKSTTVQLLQSSDLTNKISPEVSDIQSGSLANSEGASACRKSMFFQKKCLFSIPIPKPLPLGKGLSVGLPPSPRLGLRPKPHFQKLYRFIDSLKRGALAPRFAISYYLSYQNAILSSMYFFTSAIGILSCFIESRSRTVTQPSSTLSKSYVMQKGVPISSCLLYLLPIAPASS